MTSSYDLADRALDGTLADRLVAWRSEAPRPATYDQIAARLRDLGIDISRETVRRWLARSPNQRESA